MGPDCSRTENRHLAAASIVVIVSRAVTHLRVLGVFLRTGLFNRKSNLSHRSVPVYLTLFKFEPIHTKISIMARGMSSYSMSSGYFNGYSSDYEEKLLNTVWMGIVGLEVLMVLGVAVRGISRRLSPHLKLRSR